MLWAFRILVAVNLALLAVMFFAKAPGEDAAGEGMRVGFSVIYAIALAIVVGLYWLIATPWVRVPLLVVLALPLLLWVVFSL